LVLLAFALAVPCTNICAVSTAGGDTISALDVCSHGSPASAENIITLVETAYNVPAFMQATELPTEKPLIYESTEFPPAVNPPIA